MIKDPQLLRELLLAYKQRGISVEIIPQSNGDWAVFVDVPTAESRKQMSFIGPVLEVQVGKALAEIDWRRVALERLA